MTVTNFGVWIAVTCAVLVVLGAIGAAVWGHLNDRKTNDHG